MWLLVGYLTLAVTACDATAPVLPERILFVGNSRIYYYNQPGMVEAIALREGRTIATELVASGGASLHQHLGERIALERLTSGDFDAVVLNEQGTWDLNYYIEGVQKVPPAPTRFFESLEAFRDAAAAAGVDLYVLMQPRKRDRPDEDLEELIRAYREVERRVGARVIPVGLSHRLMEDRHPEIEIWDPDGNHPSDVGAFLSAVTMYGVLMGSVPSERVDTLVGPAIELEDGEQLPDSITTLVEIDGALVDSIYEVAADAIVAWSSTFDLHDLVASYVPDAGPPELPENPSEIVPVELAGRWEGSLGLYPRFLPWPARMQIDLTPGDPIGTSLRVSFGGSPADIYYEYLPVSNEGRYLQFVDPDGPDGGFVRYRITPVGDSLIGVGEFLTDVDVYGRGSIRLGR